MECPTLLIFATPPPMPNAPAWEKKFGGDVSTLRALAEEEFTTTARQINRRAKQVGAEPDYDEHWGDGI